MNNIKIRKMNVLPNDIEPLFGLWVLFELPKMSRRYQNKIFYEIRTGKYPKK